MSSAIPLGIRVEAEPIPPIAENTRYVDAGPVKIGVEYRQLTDELVDANYAASDSKAAIDATRTTSLDDEGVSLHVCDPQTGIEYLRFDLFADDPHYHYIHHGEYQQIIAFDPAAYGDMLDWAFERLRTRLPEMLEEAGAGELADSVRHGDFSSALERVRELAVATSASSR